MNKNNILKRISKDLHKDIWIEVVKRGKAYKIVCSNYSAYDVYNCLKYGYVVELDVKFSRQKDYVYVGKKEYFNCI